MNSKIKILIGILILGILILLGFVFCSTRRAVTITTDKTEYKRGETAKILVKNDLSKSTWYPSECAGNLAWGLQKLEEGEWKTIYFSLPTCCKEEETEVEGQKIRMYIEYCDFISCEQTEPAELKPGSKINYDWQLGSICEWPEKPVGVPKVEPKAVEVGTYRVSFTYGLNKEGFNLLEERTIYSSEFNISGTLASANCNLFEMPMTEEEIEGCTCPEGYEKFSRLSGAYCATNSQKPCGAHTDCPEGERCISSDGKSWFCTGQFAGCAFRDPENPEEQLCVD